MVNFSTTAPWGSASDIYTPSNFSLGKYEMDNRPLSATPNQLPHRPHSAPFNGGLEFVDNGASKLAAGRRMTGNTAAVRGGKETLDLDSRVEKIRAMNTEFNPAFPRPDFAALATLPVPKSLVASANNNGRFGVIEKEKKSSLYKTELCRSYEETGHCKYGSKCQFAHSGNEVRGVDRHPKYKTELCKTFWERGVCPYGKRCCFVHTSQDIESRKQQQNHARKYGHSGPGMVSATVSGLTSSSSSVSSVTSTPSLSPPSNQSIAEPAAIKATAQDGRSVEQLLLPELSPLVSLLSMNRSSEPSIVSQIPTPPPSITDSFSTNPPLLPNMAISTINIGVSNDQPSWSGVPSTLNAVHEVSTSLADIGANIKSATPQPSNVDALISYLDTLQLGQSASLADKAAGNLSRHDAITGNAPYIGFITTPPATPSPNLSFSSPEAVNGINGKSIRSPKAFSPTGKEKIIPMSPVGPMAMSKANSCSSSTKRLRVFQHLKEEH